jgi:hypothetical protein
MDNYKNARYIMHVFVESRDKTFVHFFSYSNNNNA